MNKWMLTLALATSVVALTACNQGGGAVAKSQAGNITQEELYEAMKDKIGEQALQQLVYEKILSKKYEVTDKELDTKIKELKDQFGDNFEDALTQYGYKHEEDLKKAMKYGMLQEKVAMKSIKITDKELKEYYENYKPEIKARHILVADVETANEVKAKLEAGEKFEDLSNQYSTDEVAKKNDGDLGWFGAGTMDPDFEAAAYNLKVEEISEPVKSSFGYHIIQITDKKEKKSYDELKGDLENELKSSKLTNEKINEIMQKELKEAKVKIRDKDLKDALKPKSSSAQ